MSFQSTDEDDLMTSERSGGAGAGVRSSDNESTTPSYYKRERRGGRRPASYSNVGGKIASLKIGNILQVIIVLAITAMVWESHSKALSAAQALSEFKVEESRLKLVLQQLEKQSIHLHENMAKLAKDGFKHGGDDGQQPSQGGGFDIDLIKKQTQKLYQMEKEFSNEVQGLQQRIQHTSRKHILEEFGEGPVQIVLELDFGPGEMNGGNKNEISILLWHDTPHAAWTWLEEIGRHVWDGSEFSWEEGHFISATPSREDPDPVGSKLEFVEESDHIHEQWTVGLRENESGRLSAYINLADNAHLHNHETCVGQVIDGFDVLQKLLEMSRDRRSIKIRSASGMHITQSEGAWRK